MNEEPAGKLRFEFYKNVSTLATAALGGAVTLLQTAFKEAPDKTLAYACIALLIASAIFAHGAQEAIVTRADPPNFRNRFFTFFLTPRFSSVEAEYIASALCGLTFGVGLACFGIFVISG